MRLRTLGTTSAAFLLALALPAAPAFAHGSDKVDKVVLKDVVEPATEGEGAKMTPVANLQYALPEGGATSQAGSDIEFARISGRDYAFAGTLRNGLQIVDITNPATPTLASVYDCRVTQGDVQVFRQGDRVLASYTADAAISSSTVDRTGSACVQEARAKGFDVKGTDLGTFLVDVTNPAKPTTVSFLPVPRGSHNMTVHPSGNYLYNSNSDLITSTAPAIRIFDIKDPTKPRLVQDLRIPFVPASLGSESHDITFNDDGTRAYSAALSQTLIFDTSDPENPKQIAQIIDPTVQLSHGADPISLKRADGTDRTLLLISDEQAGAATGTNCPGGGVHIYDITGNLEKAPRKLGAWFIAETKPSAATCTAHVFRMHGDQGLFTIAWYDQGVRVVDVAGLADLPTPTVPFVTSGNGNGIKEIGKFVFPDSNTWSFKTNAIATDGSFFGFGNDLGRGLDVYKFEGLGRTVPALVPTELRSSGAAPTANRPAEPTRGGSAGGQQASQPRAAGGSLPTTGGSAPIGGLLLVLAALSGAAVVRRSRRVDAA